MKGFSHFKLVGRGTVNFNVIIYRICKYLIKPEFFDDVFFWITGDDSNRN